MPQIDTANVINDSINITYQINNGQSVAINNSLNKHKQLFLAIHLGMISNRRILPPIVLTSSKDKKKIKIKMKAQHINVSKITNNGMNNPNVIDISVVEGRMLPTDYSVRDTSLGMKEVEYFLVAKRTAVNVYDTEPEIEIGKGEGDYEKPDGTTGGSSGDGILKNFQLIAQKNNYTEFGLNLKDSYISTIKNLPTGMSYSGNTIKGTPTVSGTFLVSVILNSDNIINGIIIVPYLPRKL